MNGQEKQMLQDFIQEKLDGKIGNFATFDFKSLNGSDKFGCSGRRFDSDDTEIMRAVYVLLWVRQSYSCNQSKRRKCD